MVSENGVGGGAGLGARIGADFRGDGSMDALLDVGRVETALAGGVVGRRIVYRLRTGSTMDDARELARDGAAEGSVVVAEEQDAGRGRFDRRWVSPAGLNLYFTVLLRPERAQLAFVNMAAALAVRGAVDAALGAATQVDHPHPSLPPSRGKRFNVSVKWPNDVRVGGRKLGGILIETEFEGGRLAFALVGIGINVNLDVSEHPEIAGVATSLRSETGRVFKREDVLVSALRGFDGLYARVRDGESLTAEWAGVLETLGKRVELRRGDDLLRGLAEGVDDGGNLILVGDDGERVSVAAGEVTSQV